MCIAILNKSGIVPESHIRTSFANNPDGAGMAWIENGSIKVFKTMKDVDKLASLYLSIRNDNDSPIVLHFRIGTHGKKDISNVHPFHINSDMIMVHNGIVDSPVIDKQKSDTFHLSLFLSNLSTYRNLIDTNSIEYGFADTICAGYSKLIFMDNDGRTSIVSEDKGHWIDQTWYSNRTYNDRDMIDIGGKSIKKGSSLNGYEKYASYESYSHWYDDQDSSSLIDAYNLYYDDDPDEALELFCEDNSLPISYVDSSGVISWDDTDTWDIDNWIEYDGKLHYMGSNV